MKEHGVYDDTLVVITSQRGIALGEHGQVGPGSSLYDEVLRVPLVFRLPLEHDERDTLRAQHPRFTRHVDVAPTVLELLGMASFDTSGGTSLLIEQERTLRARCTLENGELFAMRDTQYKLVYATEDDAFTLYNLASDPAELDNVFHVQGHLRKGWQGELRAMARGEYGAATAVAQEAVEAELGEAVPSEPSAAGVADAPGSED